MSDELGGQPGGNGVEDNGAAQDAVPETLIDLLTGAAIRDTPKNRLVQKVLRQLIETYGFDRSNIRTGYRPTPEGKRAAAVDIVIFRDGLEPADDSVERVIVCQTQKPREKLRSPGEAAPDLRKLEDKLELLPHCHTSPETRVVAPIPRLDSAAFLVADRPRSTSELDDWPRSEREAGVVPVGDAQPPSAFDAAPRAADEAPAKGAVAEPAPYGGSQSPDGGVRPVDESEQSEAVSPPVDSHPQLLERARVSWSRHRIRRRFQPRSSSCPRRSSCTSSTRQPG